MLVACALEQSQGSGCDVELGDAVLLNGIPVSGEVGVRGGSLEDDRGNTKEQWRVDNVGVASNPSDITSAEELVGVMDIKNVLSSHGRTEKVAARAVHETLWLTSGSRGVEEEQRILRVHWLWGNVGGPLLDLLVPPPISTGGPWDVGSGALVDQAAGDAWALLECIVHNLLGGNNLSSTLALVAGDDNLGLGVVDTVAERIGRETGENDRVYGTDTCAGKECDECLRNHGEVDRNSVALLDAHLLEDVCGLADLAEKLAIGQGTALVGLVSLVDDGCLVWVLDRMAIDAVV